MGNRSAYFTLKYANNNENSVRNQRTSEKRKGDFCCAKEPLLNIEIDHVIVDELNLLLHEMDVMLDNIITEVIDWDKEDDFEKTCTQQKGLHQKKLEREIKSRGVG